MASLVPKALGRVGSQWALTIRTTWEGKAVGQDEAVAVALEHRETDLTLRVASPFHGDPPPSTEDLWLYEVVELMLAGADERYLEVELSPHGRSLVLFLQGERQVVSRGAPLDYRAHIEDGHWHGVARLPIEWLPADTDRLNAFAIHGTDPNRRYLAWRPSYGQSPDFHRLEAFGRLDECVVMPPTDA